MSEQQGFISELFYRRVPQYLGLYIAGVWMAIEIGDWLIDQFALPARLTAYIFVFLAAMLPSIAVFAWTHGAPGKDEMSKSEKVLIPINLIIAIAAVLFVPAKAPSVNDNQPVVAAVEPAGPVRDSSQRVVAFFLKNNTSDSPDWLAYGLPMLVTADIDRASGRFGVYTPFTHRSLMELLRTRNFERGLGEPTTIQMELANLLQRHFFLRGELRDAATPGELEVIYNLHETATGKVVLSQQATFTEATLMDTVDVLSAAIQAELVKQMDDPPILTDLPVAEVVSPEIDAVRVFVDAAVMRVVDRDNVGFGPVLQQAVDIDPQFAEAHADLGMYYYYLGDRPSAIASLDKAQEYDYRLSTESKFVTRITRQAVAGNIDEAVKIARTWTRVEPNNERAFYSLAGLQETRSVNLDEAIASLARVREINPSANQTLLGSANIEFQRSNFDAAEEYVRAFLEAEPTRAAGQLKLAEILSAKGDFDGAVQAYEGASYLDSNSISPELGLIAVLMRKGDFSNASDRLARLRQNSLTDEETMRVVTSGVQLAGLAGRYSDAIRLMEESDEAAQRLMPPLAYALQVDAPATMMAAYIGAEPEKVLESLQAVRDNLQPPWSDFSYWYDLAVHAIADDADAYKSAFTQAEKFLLSQPNNENLNIMLYSGQAQVALYNDDREAAAQAAKEALRVSEASILNVLSASEGLSMQATMYEVIRQAGEPALAIEGLKVIVEQFPGLAMAHLYLANAYADIGNTKLARTAADRAEALWSNADAGFVYLKKLTELQAELAADA